MSKKKKQAAGSRRSSPEAAPSFLRLYLQHFVREGQFIFALAVCVFLLVSLFSYHRGDSAWSHSTDVQHVLNQAGRVGAWVSDLLLYFLGYVAYALPLCLVQTSWCLYRVKHAEMDKTHRYALLSVRVVGFVLFLLSSAALISVYFPAPFSSLPYASGGILGDVVAQALLAAFNPVGACLLLVMIFLLSAMLFSGLSWLRSCEKVGKGVSWLFGHVWRGSHAVCMQLLTTGREGMASAVKFFVDKRQAISRSSGLKRQVPTLSTQDKTVPSKKPLIGFPNTLRAGGEATREKKPARVPRAQKPHPASGVAVGDRPSLALLNAPPTEQAVSIDQAHLEARSLEVERRLKDFHVDAHVVAVHPGPVVTRFELQLAAGTKVSKITALAKDLARSLSVISVRVVEVIPGKSVIGLELPNTNRQTVVLKDILSSEEYANASSPLTLALGKDIAGVATVVDLAKMPHLLVAGTTGSGKSVGLNVMLLSLLYKATPEELRLILIDPKMLELSVYDGIPHLLAPVVTDMRDASTALRWCVVEMERRYRLMAALGVRNITGFNQKIQDAKKRDETIYDPLYPEDADNRPLLTVLPQIVVLADEFADMMVVVGKKVETLIARLAQKARAAGIHLILATQRPSVDVITGLIKANIPTRIAFQVSSKVDSRTILDQQGAEQLLGSGDMLYLPPGSGLPVRVHGAYVDDDEVHRVVAALKESGEPDYLDEILDAASGEDASGYVQAAIGESDESGEKDPLYDQAVDAVARSQRVSISSVQRRFKIGYNRAARIVEAMEAAGVVGPSENGGMRQVLVPSPER